MPVTPSTSIFDMGKKGLIICAVVLCIILLAESFLLVFLQLERNNIPEETLATETLATEPKIEEVPELATRRQPKRFVLTFTGDCTLGSEPKRFNSETSFIKTVGSNYAHPFAKVLSYFENDDFTFINFEGVLANSGVAADKMFTFRGPDDYVNILTVSSVEGVTLANNHSMDFGQSGYNNTKAVLENAGVVYVEQDKTCLYTTESGLVIGLYADAFALTEKDIAANIAQLKEAGAEVIVCAFHWGTEGSYRATETQKKFARYAVSQGAHIVVGHHPHVLQTTEFGENSAIFYSLGNFSFGGNVKPYDNDSAIVQVEFIRNFDGTISMDTIHMIPVNISSMQERNNYQPIAYEPDSLEYDRAMEKLNGTFTGPDLVLDRNYGKTEESTEPTNTEITETTPAA